MPIEKKPDLTRRLMLAATAGLVLPRCAWTQSSDHEVFCWRLQERGDTARESIGGSADVIASRTGHANWVGEGRNRALRLDGYSVCFEHIVPVDALRGNSVTMSAWVALESYPVDEAALLELESESDSIFRFSIDKWGFLQFETNSGDLKNQLKSSAPVPKGEWVHLAVNAGNSGMTLYQDSIPCGHSPSPLHAFKLAEKSSFVVGRAMNCPMIADVFPTGVLNCLLRDVRIYDGELSAGAITRLFEDSKPDSPADLEINGPWCTDDPQRPVYHALPTRAWTNEPHGLIHFRGQYHLFYQKNPNGPYWGHINWGHMTSPDLFQWTEMPAALSPEPGPDSEGCWSGSVVDCNEKLAILYTGGDGHRASICLAFSEDGIHFKKYEGNPVIPEPPQGQGFPEFRDPHVWREGDTYYLIIGSAIKDQGGTALLYRSNDLIHWEYRKPLLVGNREDSGVFWEMPVFFKVGDQYVLVVCEVPGRASYWLGSWKDETFMPISTDPQRLDLFNHLLSPTPHILEDGRAITMGIIPDERSPKECWRAGWAHLYSLPRLISINPQGKLCQAAFEGVKPWIEPVAALSNVDLPDGSMKPIENAGGRCLNVRAVFRRGDSRSFTLRFRSSPDEQEHTDIRYQWDIGRLVLDRTHSSLDQTVKKDLQDATFFPESKGKLDLEVFLDESVVEVFVDRRSAFAARIYPILDTSTNISVGSEGPNARIETVTVARIRRTQ